MVPSLRHIITASGLMAFITLSAQTVPWATPSVTLNSFPLTVNCIPEVDDQYISEGDYIGVFNDSDKCFGLAKWRGDATDFSITVYGSDGEAEGFSSGDPLNLKIWLSNEDCILEQVSKIESDNPLVYDSEAGNGVNALVFKRIIIEYPQKEYCLNDENIEPLLSYPVTNLLFVSDTTLLDVNEKTGVINPEGSAPGTYRIILDSDRCLATENISLVFNEIPEIQSLPDTSICGDEALYLSLSGEYGSVLWSTGIAANEIELTETATIWYMVMNEKGCSSTDTFEVEKITLEEIDYSMEDAGCYQNGSIDILGQVVENGRSPYTYKITNKLDQTVYEDFTEMPEGVYSLDVINYNGCILTFDQNLIVRKDCLNDNPVFSPNEDGRDDRFFIAFEGEIDIFNRDGMLKRRLTGPCYFDGNDSNGTQLPMGTYLIISDKGQKMTLTLLR